MVSLVCHPIMIGWLVGWLDGWLDVPEVIAFV